MLFKPLCLILLLCCIANCSGRERERQKCGEDGFHCSITTKCLDRKLRCTASNVCVDSQGNEDKCFEASPGRYYYYRKEASIISSGSSSSRRKRGFLNLNFRHWFVEYRGFVYEFGAYGFQELDVNDPNYKYGPRREKVKVKKQKGSSSCSRDDVLRFRDEFIKANPHYGLISNNCQDFVLHLERRLGSDCSPRQGRSLDDGNESLKANCSLPNPKSSSSMLALNSKLFASFAGLILSTIFCM